MKAFIVLSSDFKNKNQDEMIKELQNYVTKKTGAWMSPRKVSYVLFTKFVDLINVSHWQNSPKYIFHYIKLFIYIFLFEILLAFFA